MGNPFYIPAQNPIRPLEVPNALDTRAKLLQLQQLGQTVEAGKLENQQRQYQLDDQTKLRSVLADPTIDWTKPDAWDTLIKKGAQSGVSPQTLNTLRNSNIEYQKSFASMDKDRKETAAKQLGAVNDAAARILQADPESRPGAYSVERTNLIGTGMATPDMLPEQYPGDDFVKVHGAASASAKKALADSAKSQSEAQSAAADASIKGAEADAMKGGALPNNVADMDYRGLAAKAAQGIKLTPQESARKQAYEKQKTLVPQFTVNNRTPQQAMAIGPDGTVIELRPGMKVPPGTKTVAGELAGAKPNADEQKRADLVENLNENLDQLEDIVKRRPDLFGKIAGRLTGFREWAGSNDPDVSALKGIEDRLGMVQQSSHGMRSAQHVEASAQSVLNGFKNGPEAMMRSINDARKSGATFTADAQRAVAPAAQASGAPSAPAPPQGGNVKVVAPDGSVHWFKSGAQADYFKRMAGIK